MGPAERIAISVENKQLPERVPRGPCRRGGLLSGLMGGIPATTYDFFPYAGLHRPVVLYRLPRRTSTTSRSPPTLEGTDGVVDGDAWRPRRLHRGGGRVAPRGRDGRLRFQGGAAEATLRVPGARLWGPQDPHLYPLQSRSPRAGATTDAYALDIGIRTFAVRGDQLLLNGQPIQLTGFGKHEDFPINGRGLNLPLLVRDHELLRWVGANSYRTSHYPYSEEAMDAGGPAGRAGDRRDPRRQPELRRRARDLIAQRLAQCTQQLAS